MKIATRYMVPVMLLSDGYIANGSEPWPLPNLATLPRFDVMHRTDPNGYFVYQRDPNARSRARGSSPARPASSTASAASRRTR